jgi:hypothetical protein
MIDLGLYRDVLRRHRWFVLVGVIGTLGLAVLSFVNVSSTGFSYRTPQIWSNEATLVLSQQGFPEGRFSLPPTGAPEHRFATLAELYATLATSDAVVAALTKQGLIEPESSAAGQLPFAATAVPAAAGGVAPVMKITGTGTTPDEATELTIAATNAFVDFLRSRQSEAGIRENDRVQLRVVKRFGEPAVLRPRSKTPLIFILFAGLSLTVAVAFMRDNAQRRPHEATVLSERLASSGLRLASDSQGPTDSVRSQEGRHTQPASVFALLDELWPKLRREGIALVLVRYHGDGADRMIDAIASYASLAQEGNLTPVTPSHEVTRGLGEIALALRVADVETWRHGNGGVGTLVLEVAEEKATLHHGWWEANEANGASRASGVGLRRSSAQTPH